MNAPKALPFVLTGALLPMTGAMAFDWFELLSFHLRLYSMAIVQPFSRIPMV